MVYVLRGFDYVLSKSCPTQSTLESLFEGKTRTRIGQDRNASLLFGYVGCIGESTRGIHKHLMGFHRRVPPFPLPLQPADIHAIPKLWMNLLQVYCPEKVYVRCRWTGPFAKHPTYQLRDHFHAQQSMERRSKANLFGTSREMQERLLLEHRI